MYFKSKTIWFFLINIVVGFLFWFLCPFLTSKTEPYDVSLYMGIFALIVVGSGYFMPKHFWLWPIGIYFGELFHLLFTIYFFPQSEAAAWRGLGAFVMTMGLFVLLALSATGRGFRTIVSSKL